MEQQNGKKIIQVNILQAAMSIGTTLGLYILAFYFIVSMSLQHRFLVPLVIPAMLGIPVMCWFLVRRFRDKNEIPFFPFPISWMLTLISFLFATVLSCTVSYLYLRYLDHGQIGQSLMDYLNVIISDYELSKSSLTDPSQIEYMDNALEIVRSSITWIAQLSPLGMTKQLLQSSLLFGNIISLIIAIITTIRIRFH